MYLCMDVCLWYFKGQRKVSNHRPRTWPLHTVSPKTRKIYYCLVGLLYLRCVHLPRMVGCAGMSLPRHAGCHRGHWVLWLVARLHLYPFDWSQVWLELDSPQQAVCLLSFWPKLGYLGQHAKAPVIFVVRVNVMWHWPSFWSCLLQIKVRIFDWFSFKWNYIDYYYYDNIK